MSKQYLGRKLTDAVYSIFYRAKENVLYNQLIKKLGISVSYNGMREFANGNKMELPLTAFEKILSKYGYELRFYIVKQHEKGDEDIQLQSAKEILEILNLELTQLEEAKLKEQKLKENMRRKPADSNKTKENEELGKHYIGAIAKDFEFDPDVIKDFDLSENLESGYGTSDIDMGIGNLINKK